MENVPYRDEILATTNTKLAAILLVFGGKLRQRLPLEWNDVHESKDSFLDNLEDPRACRPKTQISFNFEANRALKEVVSAYQAQNAEEEFATLMNSFPLKASMAEIMVAHSRAVAQACRQALEAREFLVQLIRSMPENSKWDVIQGNGAGETVRLGKRSSDELRAEYLSKI